VDGSARRSIEDAFVSLAGMFDRHHAEVTVKFGALAAGVRTITLQVVDRLGEPWADRFAVMVYACLAPGGDPSATPTWGATSVGSALDAWTVTAGKPARLFLTDATGKVVVPLTGGVSGSVYVRAGVVAQPLESVAITY
jgi:hypothetical protein